MTGRHLKWFAVKAIAKGSKLRTDGWGAYRVVAEANLFDRLVIAALDSKAVTYKELTAGAT